MARRMRRLVAVVVLCVSGVGSLAATHSPLMHSAGILCGHGPLARAAGGTRVIVDGYGGTGGCS